MPYSALQIRLLRERLRAYHRTKKAQDPYGFTWSSVAEILFGYTKLRIRGERLRQFAEGQISRGSRSGTTDENIHAIVRFLTHPEIKALTLEDLKEPEIPHQFALQLMEALRHDDRRKLTLPPQELEGVYRAIVRADGKLFDMRLTVTISADGHLVHLAEEADVYRYSGMKDLTEWSSYERKLYHDRFSEGRGWGVLTPEDNLLGFMKRKIMKEYRDNYFYSTVGVIPDFSDGAPIQDLALLAYDVPYGLEDEAEDKQTWFEEKCRRTVAKMRHFRRMPDQDSEQ